MLISMNMEVKVLNMSKRWPLNKYYFNGFHPLQRELGFQNPDVFTAVSNPLQKSSAYCVSWMQIHMKGRAQGEPVNRSVHSQARWPKELIFTATPQWLKD